MPVAFCNTSRYESPSNILCYILEFMPQFQHHLLQHSIFPPANIVVIYSEARHPLKTNKGWKGKILLISSLQLNIFFLSLGSLDAVDKYSSTILGSKKEMCVAFSYLHQSQQEFQSLASVWQVSGPQILRSLSDIQGFG